MNGRQMADTARVGRPNLKVLFITGCAENAVLSHGHLELGMHVLTKPFEIDVVGNRIKGLIDDGSRLVSDRSVLEIPRSIASRHLDVLSRVLQNAHGSVIHSTNRTGGRAALVAA